MANHRRAATAELATKASDSVRPLRLHYYSKSNQIRNTVNVNSIPSSKYISIKKTQKCNILYCKNLCDNHRQSLTTLSKSVCQYTVCFGTIDSMHVTRHQMVVHVVPYSSGRTHSGVSQLQEKHF